MRLFVAIELEHPLRRVLLRISDDLSSFGKTIRWLKADQMHLTLKFLGEVPDGNVNAVCQTCAKVAAESAAFELTVDHCGCFPPSGKVRVIWGGGETPAGLLACAARCEDALESLGFQRESRPFAAHVTVGRVRDDRTNGRLREAIGGLRIKKASQPAKELTVFRSELTPRGAIHTALGRFRFGGAS